MKRRDFLNIGIPATGAALMAPGFLNAKTLRKINRQFLGKDMVAGYDLIINGAGFQGYFLARQAAAEGKRVLVVDKRTSPGFDLYAKKRLWLDQDGFDRLDSELKTMLLPEGEHSEIFNKEGKGSHKSLFGDEIALFSGSIRKGMLRNLIMNKIDILLMTDVCGILSAEEKISGLLLAGKHGLHTVPCGAFVDASDHAKFSRDLLGEPVEVEKAGFIFEVFGAKDMVPRKLQVSADIGLVGNEIACHPGKREDGHMFISFEFKTTTDDLNLIEQQARFISAEIGSRFREIDSTLQHAQIFQFAMECALTLKDKSLPQTRVAGHYLAPAVKEIVSCSDIIELQETSKEFIGGVRSGSAVGRVSSKLDIVGSTISADELNYSDVDEPGLIIPLKGCTFDFNSNLKNSVDCQVLVAGGGTAGAMAGIGAAEKGVSTIVSDYFNDLGGTKTMGGVMGYYHGFKDQKFFKQHVDAAEGVARDNGMSKKAGRAFYLLENLTKGQTQFMGGQILCATILDDKKVQGVVACADGKLVALKAELTIDGTGDGDVAYFAGANFAFGDPRYGQTQNYSQWDLKADVSIQPTSRDYDIIDNTKIGELQRGLFLSHFEAHYYDFHPMLTVRESRRIEGLYELNLTDAVEGTHFQDVISLASSDYDPHNVGTTPITRCGFLLPHSIIRVVEIPYRSIVPRELDGLLLSGRGFSQSHNALQFTRMSADLMVLGYLTGQIAADQLWKGVSTHNYDIAELQEEWRSLGYYPEGLMSKKVGVPSESDAEIQLRMEGISQGKQEFLFKCIMLDKEKALPLLSERFVSTNNADGKLLIAKAIAWFGEGLGNELIEDELKDLFAQELAQGYPGGYIDDYDSIRGRELNRLEGLFWRINQNIALLGVAGYAAAKDTIKQVLVNTESGGDLIPRQNAYFNGRIDLRIVPFYNRIFNMCFFIERVPDPIFADGLKELLKDERIGGFKTEQYDQVRWSVYSGSLELSIAAALARCGSKDGYDLLTEYVDDIHYIFKKFAASELKSLTGSDLRYNAGEWNSHLGSLSFPRATIKLATEA